MVYCPSTNPWFVNTSSIVCNLDGAPEAGQAPTGLLFFESPIPDPIVEDGYICTDTLQNTGTFAICNVPWQAVTATGEPIVDDLKHSVDTLTMIVIFGLCFFALFTGFRTSQTR